RPSTRLIKLKERSSMFPKVKSLLCILLLGGLCVAGLHREGEAFAGDAEANEWLSWSAGPALSALARRFYRTTYINLQTGVIAKSSGRDDNQTLLTAVTAARGKSVIIARGTTCVAGDISIPNLQIQDGGLLKITTGKVVTLTQTFDAGVYYAFANALPGQGT